MTMMMTTKSNDDDNDYSSNVNGISNDNINKYNDDEGFESTTTTVTIQPMSAAEQIAQREARFVRCLRLGLLVILLAATTTASGVIYHALLTRQNAHFEAAFVDYSNKITTEFKVVADRCFGAIAAFSTTITSITTSTTNATWPYVMIPEFEAQARHTAELANVKRILFAPIVTGNERKEWEDNFVPQNVNRWIKQSIIRKELYGEHVNETMLSYEVRPLMTVTEEEIIANNTPVFSNLIFSASAVPDTTGDGISDVSFDVSTDDVGPYIPVWHIAPFVPGFDDGTIGFDLNTDVTFDRNVIRILQQRKAALGRYTTEGYDNYGDSYGDGNPTSGFYYPVLKDLPRNSTVGGTLFTFIFWLPFFSNILPDSATGVIGVLGNSCNQTFTFRIDGANATFVGNNDLHDANFDDLKQEVPFLSLLTDSFDHDEYLGFPIDDSGCTYTLQIYPSMDLHDVHVTNSPLISSIVILLVFLGTSSVFVLYDRLVERRQRLVQKEAESSGAIVSSLFPDAYRERLMAAQGNNQTGNATNPKLFGIGGSGGNNVNDQPIADLYPDCTVFFADIAGFTHWSSTRQPVQVFCLLQAIFAAIDKVAKKFNIFKVETIGDCYMAVTGLPNPQPNHAQLMSRFASDCLVQMRETIERLVDTLGADTADLTLRMGLHSGPVTAGILRGEKSRFQLFGDTVNTASRMESTGEKSRIQLSSTTADLLRQAGKGHWLQAREDLVEAKGKGKLQTYWLVYDRCQSQVSHDSEYYDGIIATPHGVDDLFEI